MSEGRGGFILYPSGERQDDPRATVALPGNQPDRAGENPGLTFDVVTGTWVPVPLHWLAPSGLTYAYVTQQKIRAVTVIDGTSGDVTTTGGWELIGVVDDGVYARQIGMTGAWYIPFGELPKQLTAHGRWERFSNGALWGFDTSLHVIRHSVETGAESDWGRVAISDSYINGFDNDGEPVINGGGELQIHHQDGATTPIWPGTAGTSAGYVWGDPHGVWFEVISPTGQPGAPGSGIFLWKPEAGATLISREAVHPMGRCI